MAGLKPTPYTTRPFVRDRRNLGQIVGQRGASRARSARNSGAISGDMWNNIGQTAADAMTEYVDQGEERKQSALNEEITRSNIASQDAATAVSLRPEPPEPVNPMAGFLEDVFNRHTGGQTGQAQAPAVAAPSPQPDTLGSVLGMPSEQTGVVLPRRGDAPSGGLPAEIVAGSIPSAMIDGMVRPGSPPIADAIFDGSQPLDSTGLRGSTAGPTGGVQITPSERRDDALTAFRLGGQKGVDQYESLMAILSVPDDETARAKYLDSLEFWKPQLRAIMSAEPGPEQEEAWRQGRALAGSLGVDVSNIPEEFSPETAEHMLGLFDETPVARRRQRKS